jgi:transposase
VGMPRPYSQDLRDRVVASVAGGRSCRASAKIFSVSVATVVRWWQRFRTRGSAAALAMGGHRPHRLASRRDWLLARIACVFRAKSAIDSGMKSATDSDLISAIPI